MMASSVTPPADDEGAEVDRVVEAGGAAIYVWGCLGLSCAAFRLTVAAFMAPITEKRGDSG